MGMNALPRRLDARSQKKEDSSIVRYIVIGGGIAGVCCAQEIARLKKHDSIEVVIITATELLKESAGVMKITNHLEEVSVFERTADRFSLDNPRIRVIQGSVLSIDTSNKIVRLKDDNIFIYEKLCICTGAQPKMIAFHTNIIGIRDLQSVTELAARLSSARKVLIVGNGGIALELVHSLSFCDVDWVVRDRFLGSSFFDASASAFVMPGLLERISAPSSAVNTKVEIDTTGIKKTVVTIPTDTLKHIIVDNAAVATIDSTDDTNETDLPVDIALKEYQRDLRHQGAALGPEWLVKSKLLDNLPGKLKQSAGNLNIHYQQDIVAIREGLNGCWRVIDSSDLDKHILSDIEATQKINSLKEDFQDPSHQYPLYVLTSNNNVVGCDFLVSATGVIPCVDFVSSEFLRSDESSNDQSNSSSSAIDFNSVKETKSRKRKVENIGQRKEGALAVNELMETSVKDVYAAGDCCSYQSAHRYHTNEINSIADETSNNIMAGKHWFQMRLWTQARSMGLYAAQCLCGVQDNHGGDFAFEIFAHVTRFFGYKVVLLGRYNAQGLGIRSEILSKTMVVSQDGLQVQDDGEAVICENGDRKVEKNNDIEIWTRMTTDVEYVKVVVYKGKVVGAMLIGDTGLEEVFENLILNMLDVSAIGIDLLNPLLDLEDYFD